MTEGRSMFDKLPLRLAACFMAAALLGGCSGRVVTAVPKAEKTDGVVVEDVLAQVAEAGDGVEVYERVETGERVVSVVLEGFTDDASMRRLADTASGMGVPVVFFIGYVDASDYPDTVRYLAQRGCEIGNYAMDGEKNMQEDADEKNARAFQKAQLALTTAAGSAPTLLRCNGSVYSEQIRRIAAACGLSGAVQPSDFLNHRSFPNEENALHYVRKLQRGAIISIKLGQELDGAEFDTGEALDEKPAIDKPPSITQESILSSDDLYDNVGNVLTWLLDALRAEQYTVVRPDALQNAAQTNETPVKALSAEEARLYDPAQYAAPVTDAPLGVARTDAVSDDAFDGAVFVGDEATAALESYVQGKRETEPGCLGTARFLASDGLGAGNALWQVSADSRHPVYEGEQTTVEDAVGRMGNVKRVYLMLGTNDVALYSVEEFVGNYRTLIHLIREKAPGVSVYVQSILPVAAGREDAPTNERIFPYDLALARMCEEYGYTYIDVASDLRDASGALPAGLCSDADGAGLRINGAAAELWVRYLRTHTTMTEKGAAEQE